MIDNYILINGIRHELAVAIDAKYDGGTNSTGLIVSNSKYTGNSDARLTCISI